METTTAAVQAALASLKLYHSQTQSTGLPGVDHVTGGMKLGELWVLAGPGSCGLTGLALQHAAFAAGAGRRVVVVTPLENSAETLLRILGPALTVHPGQFVEPKWPRDLDTVDDLVSEVAPQLNLVAIGADREWAAVLAEILSAREPLDLLVIDDAHACPELLRNAVATTYPSVAGSSLPHTMRQLARRRRTTLLLTLSAETVASDPAWARSADVLATLEPALDPGAAGWGDVQLRFVRDKPMQATVDLTFSLRDGHLIEFAGYDPAIEQRVTSPTNLFSAEARINRGRARQRKRARTDRQAKRGNPSRGQRTTCCSSLERSLASSGATRRRPPTSGGTSG